MDELRLIEKLKLIEALFAGATTQGERVAAERARERILERLSAAEQADPAVEYRFTLSDMYARRVFVALCRRYGLEPYRYKRQRYTTVMLRVSKRFVDETLWPQFQELSDTLHAYLSEVTDRVVAEVLHADSSEATVVEEGGALPDRAAPPAPPPGTNRAPRSTAPAAAGDEGGGAPSRLETPGKNRNKRKRKGKKRKKGRRR